MLEGDETASSDQTMPPHHSPTGGSCALRESQPGLHLASEEPAKRGVRLLLLFDQSGRRRSQQQRIEEPWPLSSRAAPRAVARLTAAGQVRPDRGMPAALSNQPPPRRVLSGGRHEYLPRLWRASSPPTLAPDQPWNLYQQLGGRLDFPRCCSARRAVTGSESTSQSGWSLRTGISAAAHI